MAYLGLVCGCFTIRSYCHIKFTKETWSLRKEICWLEEKLPTNLLSHGSQQYGSNGSSQKSSSTLQRIVKQTGLASLWQKPRLCTIGVIAKHKNVRGGRNYWTDSGWIFFIILFSSGPCHSNQLRSLVLFGNLFTRICTLCHLEEIST